MLVRTANDLGTAIRDHRKRRGWDQQTLASHVGVSRQWIIDVEKGKPGASIGLVLRALDALGMPINLAVKPSTRTRVASIDIDQIVRNSRRNAR
ncbi:MAG: helix-turn-helix transcriptional regulator [Rhodospirillaceae bacterium]|nr:helix-turn-helix transcriptional regulator [Rhodospirillaceae bacterium]